MYSTIGAAAAHPTGAGEMCSPTGAGAAVLLQGRRADEDTEGAGQTFSTTGAGVVYPAGAFTMYSPIDAGTAALTHGRESDVTQ